MSGGSIPKPTIEILSFVAIVFGLVFLPTIGFTLSSKSCASSAIG